VQCSGRCPSCWTASRRARRSTASCCCGWRRPGCARMRCCRPRTAWAPRPSLQPGAAQLLQVIRSGSGYPYSMRTAWALRLNVQPGAACFTPCVDIAVCNPHRPRTAWAPRPTMQPVAAWPGSLLVHHWPSLLTRPPLPLHALAACASGLRARGSLCRHGSCAVCSQLALTQRLPAGTHSWRSTRTARRSWALRSRCCCTSRRPRCCARRRRCRSMRPPLG